MTFPGALGRSTRPWSQAMLLTGFGRAPKSVTSRAGALFLSQNLRRRGGAGSAGCASRYRAWRRPRRGILPAQVNGRWESETARRTSQNCDLFSGIEMVCPKEAENWNPDDEKWENTPVNGRLPRFCEGSHVGHKASLFSQPLFPVPSSARAFLAAGNSTSVWNARLVSGDSSAVEETREKERGNEVNVCPFQGVPMHHL